MELNLHKYLYHLLKKEFRKIKFAYLIVEVQYMV